MKPRKLNSPAISARAECVVGDDGERIVDTAIDLFSDKTTADELKRYGQWLIKASKWLKEKSDER